jgi:lysozyme
MKISDTGIALIKKWEGLHLTAYLCPRKIPTIGWGHTGPDVTKADVGKKTITLQKATSLLKQDLERFEAYVSKTITTPLEQKQFDALVSLAFNLGSWGPTLTKVVSARRFHDAPYQIRRYIHVDAGGAPCRGKCGVAVCKGRYLQGLINRRNDEVKLFQG